MTNSNDNWYFSDMQRTCFLAPNRLSSKWRHAKQSPQQVRPSSPPTHTNSFDRPNRIPPRRPWSCLHFTLISHNVTVVTFFLIGYTFTVWMCTLWPHSGIFTTLHSEFASSTQLLLMGANNSITICMYMKQHRPTNSNKWKTTLRIDSSFFRVRKSIKRQLEPPP